MKSTKKNTVTTMCVACNQMSPYCLVIITSSKNSQSANIFFSLLFPSLLAMSQHQSKLNPIANINNKQNFRFVMTTQFFTHFWPLFSSTFISFIGYLTFGQTTQPRIISLLSVLEPYTSQFDSVLYAFIAHTKLNLFIKFH